MYDHVKDTKKTVLNSLVNLIEKFGFHIEFFWTMFAFVLKMLQKNLLICWN